MPKTKRGGPSSARDNQKVEEASRQLSDFLAQLDPLYRGAGLL
ncbi:MAG TPA: hypothetical protein VHI72_09335 [Hyphomicrobiaceae bacterium]|jgi:hypothetical protein|nr:hypothetical protein [Hyphomicrobiaceae bacterium]